MHGSGHGHRTDASGDVNPSPDVALEGGGEGAGARVTLRTQNEWRLPSALRCPYDWLPILPILLFGGRPTQLN